jgi:gliding motility-associated-like protein
MKRFILLTAAFLILALQPLFACQHSIILYDDLDDGWHGNNSVDVFVNGVLVLDDITIIEDESGSEFVFTALDGETIEVTFSDGSYPYECYYSVEDGYGNNLATDIYPDSYGTWTGTAACPPPCVGTPDAGTVSPLTQTVAIGTSATISISGYTIAGDITFQWQESTSAMGPFVNVSGGSGANTPMYTTDVLSSDMYYQCVVTCTNGGGYDVSDVAEVNAVLEILMQNGNTSTCEAIFYDSGGDAGDYSSSETFTYTFYPATPGNLVQVTFTSFNTESGYDELTIYNGNSTAAPQIGVYSGTTSPGIVTSSAADGSLTFYFDSDWSGVRAGWRAVVSCLPPCSGTPFPGNISPLSQQITDGNSTTLTLSGYSAESGLSFQWQESTSASGPFVNVSGGTGATTTSYTTPTLTQTTYYQCVVTCTNTGDQANSPFAEVEVVTEILMQDGDLNTCEGLFYDTGGSSGNYSSSEDLTLTIYPSTSGGLVQVDFSSFNTESGYDELTIYDGNSTAAPVIGTFSGTNSPGVVTSSSADGSLTFYFDSDGSSTDDGWEASITCLPPCVGTPYAGIAEISLSEGCTGYTMNVDLSAYAYSDNIGGIVYQWQSSPDGTSWTDIPGANDPSSSTVTVSTETYYRLMLTCTNSGESSTSNVVSYVPSPCTSYNIGDPGSPISTCNAMFYDSGGAGGTYGASEDETITFCSDNGEHIRIDFLSFATEDNGLDGRDQDRYDILYVYDGPDMTVPMFELSGEQIGHDLVPTIISTNTCITFRFVSDGGTQWAGWEAHVSCTSEENTVAGQYCGAAPNICNLDGYTGVTSNFYNPEDVGGQIDDDYGATLFPDNILDNNSFVTFVPSSSQVELSVDIANCTGGVSTVIGVQMAVYSGTNCSGFGLIAIYDEMLEGNNNIQLSGLVPGNTYYVLIDGYNGAICDYSITAESGIDLADIDITNATICQGESITITASGGTNYSWIGPGGFTSPDASITVSDAGVYQVEISGGIPACPSTVTLSSVIFVSTGTSPTFDPIGPYCEGETIPALPTTSLEGIVGTWSPATVDNTTTADYTFTPTPGANTDFCALDTTITVTIDPIVTPSFDPIDPICEGDALSPLPTTSLEGIVGTWAPALDNTQTTTYTFTPDPGVCATTTDLTITVDPIVPPIFTQLGPYCINATPDALPTTSTNGITGSWSPDPIATDVAGTFTYSFTADGGQCTTDTIMEITIDSEIPATFDQLGPYCQKVIPDVLPTTSNNGMTGSWSPSNIDTNTAGITTYTFTPDAGQCGAITTMDIEIWATPTPIASNNSPICEGENLQLTGQPDGMNSYAWNGPNAFTSTSQSPTVSAVATLAMAGTYTLTVEDGNGCTASTNTDVIVNANPTVTASNNGPLCEDEILILTGDPSGMNNYTWTGPNSFTSTVQSPTVSTSATADMSGVYILTVEDANGCTGTGQTLVDVNANVTVTATNNGPVCEGESIMLGGAPSGMSSYAWSGPNGFSTTSQNPTVSTDATTAMTGTYTLVVTNTNGCTGSGTTTVVINPNPTISNIIGTSELCNGDCNGSIQIVPAGGASPYIFSIDAGANTQSSDLFNGLCSDNYQPYVEDANGCSVNYGNYELTGPSPLTGNIVNLENQNCGSLGSIEVTGVGGTPPYSYQWSPQITNFNEGVATELGLGSYTVTISDANNCQFSINFGIVDAGDLEINAVVINHPVCFGDNNGSVNVQIPEGTPDYIISWAMGTDTISTSSLVIEGLSSGLFTVTVNDASGCMVVDSVTLIGPDAPLGFIIDKRDISCYGDNDGRISASGQGGMPPYTYEWTSNFGTSNENPISNLPEGFYALNITDSYGCEIDTTVIINQPAPLEVSHVAVDPSCIGNNDGYIELTVVGGTEPYRYLWYDMWVGVPYFDQLYEGDYELLVQDANGCQVDLGTFSLIDIPIECLRIPNAFTPNGDDNNDTWIIENLEMFPNAVVKVFNRWGQLVYEGHVGDDPWDGQNLQGNFVPTGSYQYIINLFNRTEPITGIVTVVY